MRSQRWLWVSVALLLAACTSGGATDSPGQTTQIDPAAATVTLDPAAATATLEAVRLDDPATLDAVGAIAGEPATLAAATILLTANPLPAPSVRWAATYVYSLYGKDPAPLRPMITDDTPGVPLMAAAGLVSLGDPSGFSVLIEALTNQAQMPGWDSPLPVWQYATAVLVGSTAISEFGPPDDAETTRVAIAQARWRTWLATTQPTLKYDSASQIWGAP